MPSWSAIRREIELAAIDFISERVALGDEEMTRLFLKKWEREGGMAGTFGRLVEQAKSAPAEESRLSYLDEQIIEEMLRPIFEGRKRDDPA